MGETMTLAEHIFTCLYVYANTANTCMYLIFILYNEIAAKIFYIDK